MKLESFQAETLTIDTAVKEEDVVEFHNEIETCPKLRKFRGERIIGSEPVGSLSQNEKLTHSSIVKAEKLKNFLSVEKKKIYKPADLQINDDYFSMGNK